MSKNYKVWKRPRSTLAEVLAGKQYINEVPHPSESTALRLLLQRERAELTSLVHVLISYQMKTTVRILSFFFFF